MITTAALLSLAIAALAGFVVVGVLFSYIRSLPVDDPKAEHISQVIAQGAMTFLGEEYKVIGFVALVPCLLLIYFASFIAALCFAVGAVLSLTTGFIGMRAATLANVRTTLAAKNKGERAAFLIAFFGGGIMGFAVASMGLLGLGGMLFFAGERSDFAFLLSCFLR